MDPTLKGMLISISLLIVGATISFLVARFWFQKNQKLQIDKEMSARIIELEKQTSIIGQTVMPISKAFQDMLIKQLTHEDKPVLDLLMAGIGPPTTLTAEQQVQLLFELKSRSEDMTALMSQSERNAAAMLPAVMQRVVDEDNAMKALGGVSVPQPPITEKKEEEKR